jgi:hypothetical protein
VAVLWALLNIGGIFDHRRWALYSELLRLPAMAALVGSRLPVGSWLGAANAGLAMAVVALWLFVLRYRHQFDAAPPIPSRVTDYGVPNPVAAEGRPAAASGMVPSAGLDRGQVGAPL